MNFHLKFL